MKIRLISTEPEYEEMLAEIRRLWSIEPVDADKLELLAMLAHRYEREREPLPALDPIDAILFRMDQAGLSRKDLVPIFGTPGRVSEVLRGKRPLSLEMIRKLHWKLGIPLESLIPEKAVRGGARKSRRRPLRRRAA
jgi:HTH-type transcriptional regulator/antitoxin HigA